MEQEKRRRKQWSVLKYNIIDSLSYFNKFISFYHFVERATITFHIIMDILLHLHVTTWSYTSFTIALDSPRYQKVDSNDTCHSRANSSRYIRYDIISDEHHIISS